MFSTLGSNLGGLTFDSKLGNIYSSTQYPPTGRKSCVVLGSQDRGDDDSILVGCYAVSSGKQ
jgi:hypothetical protein